MAFDLQALLVDVFDPEGGEVVTVACDVPAAADDDTAEWRERREMAHEWQGAFQALGAQRGFSVNPLLTYRATTRNNADLPADGVMAGAAVRIEEVLNATTLAAFLTQFSATAPLDAFSRQNSDFRAASMPGLQRRMEQSALAADYREVARRCTVLMGLLEGAFRLDVRFSTGHECSFDLRDRRPEADDGFLPRGKQGDRIINLPSGEVFIVPYEGEKSGQASLTAGSIPVQRGDELVVLTVAANRITSIEGDGNEAARLRQFFSVDPARANIAEVAFGCNDRAVVTGNVLEDEKAGFHWAFGRSEHLGGTVSPASFASPENVVHQDVVYARGNPIQVALAVLDRPGGASVVIREGDYLVF